MNHDGAQKPGDAAGPRDGKLGRSDPERLKPTGADLGLSRKQNAARTAPTLGARSRGCRALAVNSIIGVPQCVVPFEAHQYEPVAAALGHDDRLRQSSVTVNDEVVAAFAGRASFPLR